MKSKRLTLSVLGMVVAVANAVLPSFLILPTPTGCSVSYIIILPVYIRKAL